MIGCAQNNQAHPPVGGILSQEDLNVSKNRAKNLNQTERIQIQDWINNQNEKFYPMSLNYWVNIENLSQKNRKADGEEISYQYVLYDFDNVKLYEVPKKNLNVQFGKFEDLKVAMNKIGVAGMTVTNVLGCGIQKGLTEYYRGVSFEMNLLPKIQVDIVVSKVPVSEVVETARKVLYTGNIGDGKIFVYDVKHIIKVRTGETDFDALQNNDD